MSSQKEPIMVKTGKVKVNDINMYYEIHGEGFPLVMIRGLSANIDWWPTEFLNAVLKNFKTIIFDNRGAGRTDKPDIEYSIKMMADDTVGLMNALNIKKAHVLGTSMGGMIAQEIAFNYPEKIEKLVLCSTSCGVSKAVPLSEEVLQTMRAMAEGLTQEEKARVSISLAYNEDFVRDNPDYIEDAIRKMLIAPIPDYSFQRQLIAMSKWNAGRRLKKINIPTLIVQGKKDILVQPQNAEILAKFIPGAKLALFDNSGHEIFSHEIVVNTIINFLK